MNTRTLPIHLTQFLAKHGIKAADCMRSDGRCSLPYDGGRLDIFPLSNTKVVLEAEVVQLPFDIAVKNTLIECALHFSTTQMRVRQDSLAEVSMQNALVLQHDIGAVESLMAMETAITDFLNAVDRWRRVLRQ